MQKLPLDADFNRRLAQGDYVIRRLRQARLADLMATLIAASELLEAKGAAWIKARRAAFASQADRDGSDDTLDEVAKSTRSSLAGRATNAQGEKPYTSIFPNGIDYYTAAPLDQQVTRYQELADRLRTHLPEGDPLREPVAARLEALVVEYEAAVKDVARARRALSLAATDLDDAEEAFDLTLERIHGALSSRFDRARARRFFPRYRTATSQPVDAPSVPEVTEA